MLIKQISNPTRVVTQTTEPVSNEIQIEQFLQNNPSSLPSSEVASVTCPPGAINGTKFRSRGMHYSQLSRCGHPDNTDSS